MEESQLTPEDAFKLTIQGIDEYQLSTIFFNPFKKRYEESRTSSHEHSVDMALNIEHYYFYDIKIVNKTGVLCALQRMAFTVGLMVDLYNDGGLLNYRYRYCFPSLKEAYESLQQWNGEEYPPGNWIKRKGEGGDLRNPNINDGFDD